MKKKLTESAMELYVKNDNYVYYKTEKRADKTGRTNNWINISCGEHVPYWVRFHHFKKGQRCPECLRQSQIKWNENTIREFVAKSEYKLLAIKLPTNGNITRVTIQCQEGHDPYECRIANFINGTRCPECSGNKKYTIEKIKKLIESEDNYKLLSNEYKHNLSPLVVKCKEHNLEFITTWANWQSGSRCKFCGFDKLSSDRRHDFTFIKTEIEQGGAFELLSNDYKNNCTLLKVKCMSCGEEFLDTYANFRIHPNCKICTRRNRYTREELLDIYKNIFQKVKHIPSSDDLKRYNAPQIRTYGRYFGNTVNLLKILNIDIEKYTTKGYGVFCVDNNGDLCHSKEECLISNFLIENKIKFKKETLYKDIIDTSKLYRFDWVIYKNNKQFYVEYFGMYNENKQSKIMRNYCEKTKIKTTILKNANIIDKCILIYPDDIKDKSLNEIFTRIL
jgi:Zn ribbon nucleic-acid-binding protein